MESKEALKSVLSRRVPQAVFHAPGLALVIVISYVYVVGSHPVLEKPIVLNGVGSMLLSNISSLPYAGYGLFHALFERSLIKDGRRGYVAIGSICTIRRS